MEDSTDYTKWLDRAGQDLRLITDALTVLNEYSV